GAASSGSSDARPGGADHGTSRADVMKDNPAAFAPAQGQESRTLRTQVYARFRFATGTVLAGATFADFFFVLLTASRLFFKASIRLTTFGGASTCGATTSSPAIFLSMM